MTAPFLIRDARASDAAFITDAWLSSYRVRTLARIEREIRKLARTSRIRIACDRSDEDTLLAFAAFGTTGESLGTDALHYAYVKQGFRGEGLARALIEPETIRAYTFRTDDLARLKPAQRGWIYEPRIIL